MIIRGGENIYPKEIETALYGHDERRRSPDVRDGRRAAPPVFVVI
jgi:acyl-CoA synthetase (AMP-forming)/AMP-acid ligase II